MDVKPIVEDNTKKIVKVKQYIEFKWYVWRSHKKALVKFSSLEEAHKALEELQKYPNLDQAPVQVKCQDSSLIIDHLNVYTDQITIQEAMKGFGEVKEVEILKTPLKEVSGEDFFLQGLIKEVIAKQNNQLQQDAKFKAEQIEKAKNGLRVCRVHMTNVNLMNIIANDLNKTIGKLGQARLYAQTWFQTPIMVPVGSTSIYQQILEQVFIQANKPNINHYIKQSDKKTYIILRSQIKQTLDLFTQKLTNSLKGYPIELSQYQKTIILSQIGLANILDLQQKYNCKLIVDQINRILSVLVSWSKISTIKSQITARVEDHFFYRLSINRKTYRYLSAQPQKLNEIQANYNLRQIQLQKDMMALLLQGSALNVQKAFNYLMHLIESLTVAEENMINQDVCLICCDQPHRPYRLQNCCHKFCRSCLLDHINMVLGDNSLFPITCPHCQKEVVLDDLDCIMEPGQWNKTITMATNQHLVRNAETLTFCYTAGCKQINSIKGDHIQCDVCLGCLCIECKGKYHPGMTCEEAKGGGDELFKKYMLENGVRQCPNQKCKIPVIRTDGCYRVTCTRCNKSMCFKCQPDKMEVFQNYTLCYNHLQKVHGGYW